MPRQSSVVSTAASDTQRVLYVLLEVRSPAQNDVTSLRS